MQKTTAILGVLAAAMSGFHAAAQNTTTNTTTTTSSTSTTTNTTTTTTLYSSKGTSFSDFEYLGVNSTRMTVSKPGGFSIGDSITLTEGAMSESTKIMTFDGSALILQPRLQNTYTPGAVDVEVTAIDPNTAPYSAGNDPIAWFGKESREFWLPVGKLTPILHTPHLNMLATTFVGSPKEQWIDRVVITNADGFHFATVQIKKNINSFNLSKAVAANSFETIDLTLGTAKSPLKEIPEDLPGGDKGYYQRMEVSVITEKLNKVFNWLPWHIDQTHIGKARREAVIISSPEARFLIISSAAVEYYGPLSYLSIDYAHLDIHIIDMKNRASVRGLLPEIWGMKKMSNRTKQLTCPPWSEDKCASDEGKAPQIFSV